MDYIPGRRHFGSGRLAATDDLYIAKRKARSSYLPGPQRFIENIENAFVPHLLWQAMPTSLLPDGKRLLSLKTIV